ncbi:MAG: polysaccharide pyruvyl transferase family protein [Pseudomonadota bacterium]
MVILLRVLILLFSIIFRPFNRKWKKGDEIRCLVVGYGGANNTGAESRTVEALKQMLGADNRLKLTLTSLDRKQTLRYLKETERLQVAQINSVFIFSILHLVLKTDLVVLVEGSCFKDNFASALLWFFMYAASLAQKLGKPTMAYAVDAGNMRPGNKKWARQVANKMDLIITRTQAAANLLQRMGVTNQIKVTTDTAFTQPEASVERVDEILISNHLELSKPIVGIAFEELFWWPVNVNFWKALRGVKEDHYKSVYYHSWTRQDKQASALLKENMASYAEWVREKYQAQVVFFAMERLDIDPCLDVINKMVMPTVLFDSNNYDAAEITGLLRRLDWLVTCRYHALVLSMGGGIPVIGLAHDERIETIMQELSLKQDYFIDYKEENILEKLRDKTQKLVANSEQVSQNIKSAVPSYLAKMQRNQKYFQEFIKTRFPT